MLTSRCPACNSDVVMEEGSYERDLVTCAICGTDLEIASLHPPRLIAISGDEDEGQEGQDNDSADKTTASEDE